MSNRKQAIYLLHPHGICSLTHAFHINTDITNWPHRNIYSIISYIIDNCIPFSLDLINHHNHMITSKYAYMKDALQEGKSISMCLGNYTEGQYDNDHRITAIVKKRKGIFKMAIETGVPIIPVLSYGEQSIFKKINTLGISDIFYKITGIRWSFPDISSMIEWLTIYKKPLDKKVVTYIGNPIEVGEARTPTSNDINELRTKYMEALRTLYKDTKPDDYEDDIVFV
jgi:1-acyl-sn-glycerol-3-phosphate acyltransferase